MKVTDQNDLPDVVASLRSMAEHEVEIGIFGDQAEQPVGDSKITMRDLAVILHEGCDIRVTPKMRAYLHHMGLHLSPKTKFIHIPPRPFVDPILTEIEAAGVAALQAGIDQIVANPGANLTQETWTRVGLTVVGMIRKSMIDLNQPANHPFTIQQKGSSNPLVDHGHLQRAIVHEVRHKGLSAVTR